MIAFDDDVARRLATGTRTLDDLVRAGSRARHEAVGEALHDFAGAHRVLFEAAVAAEALDRMILARRLDSPRNGSASPYDCTRANRDRGARYDFDLLAPRGPEERTDPTRAAVREHSADVIAAYWRSLGMTVTILSTDARYPTVYADGGPVHRASFATDGPDDSYMVGVTSYCQPGDVRSIMDDDDAQRAASVVLPGDEGTIDRNDPRWSEMSRPRQ